MANTQPLSDLKKQNYLQEASREAQTIHPERTPGTLTCPINGTLMQDPVVTPEGFVYEKKAIIKKPE